MKKQFFDYHYYRVAKFFLRRDGTNALSALLSVTSVQALFIMNIWVAITIAIDDKSRKFTPVEKIAFFLMFFVLYYYNHKRYDKRYWKLKERWKDEPNPQKTINGIVVVLTLVGAWFLVFVNALIFDRFR